MPRTQGRRAPRLGVERRLDPAGDRDAANLGLELSAGETPLGNHRGRMRRKGWSANGHLQVPVSVISRDRYGRRRAKRLVRRSAEIAGGKIPVGEVRQEGLDEFRSHVAVVDVI